MRTTWSLFVFPFSRSLIESGFQAATLASWYKQQTVHEFPIFEMHEMEMKSKIKMTLDRKLNGCCLSLSFIPSMVWKQDWMPGCHGCHRSHRETQDVFVALESIVFSLQFRKQIYINCFVDFCFSVQCIQLGILLELDPEQRSPWCGVSRQNMIKNRNNKIRERQHEWFVFRILHSAICLLLLFLFRSLSFKVTVPILNVWRCRVQTVGTWHKQKKEREKEREENGNSKDTVALNDNNNNHKY